MPVLMPHPLAYVFKKELLRVPFFGWAMGRMDMIHIDRADGARAFAKVVQQGQRLLDQGTWVIMFPEGTRIDRGQQGTYKTGGTRLAIRTGAPVIPIAVTSAKCWPRKAFIKRPGDGRVLDRQADSQCGARGRRADERGRGLDRSGNAPPRSFGLRQGLSPPMQRFVQLALDFLAGADPVDRVPSPGPVAPSAAVPPAEPMGQVFAPAAGTTRAPTARETGGLRGGLRIPARQAPHDRTVHRTRGAERTRPALDDSG